MTDTTVGAYGKQLFSSLKTKATVILPDILVDGRDFRILERPELESFASFSLNFIDLFVLALDARLSLTLFNSSLSSIEFNNPIKSEKQPNIAQLSPRYLFSLQSNSDSSERSAGLH